MKTFSLIIIFVLCYPILASINEEAEGIKVDTNEDELEDEDPIIEDLSDIDLTSLPVVSREIRKSGMFDCEFLEEEFVTYSYPALARSGNRVEVHLAAIHQLPAQQTKIQYTNPNFPGIKGFLDLRFHLNCFKQDDPQVIDVIKTMLIPPSDKEYNFKNLSANINGEVGQPLDAEQLVFGEDFKNGFFIEAGSSDGEFNSDTLHFEINKGWTGLLVEPNPLMFEMGVGKNRKASLLPTCLATQTQPHIVDFDFEAVLKNDTGTFSMGGIVNDGRDDTFQVQCMPLYSILLALGNPTVNYFSLDLEGAEFAVLKTIPWDKVDIQVFTVETHMLGEVFPGSRAELIEYMETVAGYNHIKDGHAATNSVRERLGTTDDLFVKKGVQMNNQKTEL